jgi:protein-L-isoaspartate(D-aspartate) O-methyltransferase
MRYGFSSLIILALFWAFTSACLAQTEVPVTSSATEAATTAPLPTPESLNRQLEDSEDRQRTRQQLVERYIQPFISDERVLAAMQQVARHSFVPVEHLPLAYEDHPLPIGYGQTISQPSLVAMMTELLEIEAGDKVLEIGTGSGYQAAILGELTDQVFTVEIIPELASIASALLQELGYDHIQVDRRDGYFGWEEHAPFDAIIVTAAADHLPNPLIQQLNSDGGRMVIPIGPVGNVQTLWLVTRQGDDVNMERLIPVRFVPFTREGEGPAGQP